MLPVIWLCSLHSTQRGIMGREGEVLLVLAVLGPGVLKTYRLD